MDRQHRGSRGRGRGRGKGEQWRGRGAGSSGSWGAASGGRGKRDCLAFKFLHRCDGKDNGACSFSHRIKVETASETVDVPKNVPIAMAIGKRRENLRILNKINVECWIATDREKEHAVKILVDKSHKDKLQKLVETLQIRLSQMFPVGPQWCYLHTDGVGETLRDTSLQFREYKGRLPVRQSGQKWLHYELCSFEGRIEQDASLDALAAKSPMSPRETKEGAYHAIKRVHEGTAAVDGVRDKEDHPSRVILKYQDHIKEMLESGLKYHCDEKRQLSGCVAKLEARVGKLLWAKLPEDVTSGVEDWGIERFSTLLFSDENHSRTFSTDVQEECAEALCSELRDEERSCLETFDIKFTALNSGTEYNKHGIKMDMRVKFERGTQTPEILLVKQNETKTAIFELVCLHRKHDLRMTLNCFEIVKPDDELYCTATKLLRTMTLPNPEDHTISLMLRSDDWNVHFIRHKIKKSFIIHDKYMVTVDRIRECVPEWSTAELGVVLELTPDQYNINDIQTHTEIEFHNLAWDCAFGRDAGRTPDQSLALLMEEPQVDQEVGRAIPHPWQAEHILQDFEEFWEHLDALNDMLEDTAA